MKKTQRIILSLTIAAIIIILLGIWLSYENTALELTECTVEFAALPAGFDGFRIAVVSDLHNTEFGRENEELLALLRESSPDMIAITGDLIDSRRTDVGIALDFAAEAVLIAPCYYVTGNHESRVPEEYAALREGLIECGVTVLEDESIELVRGEHSITLIGMNDSAFACDDKDLTEDIVNAQLEGLTAAEDGFTLLLTHRPKHFDIYAENGADLTLCGHMHGAQIQLPFLGGVYAPSYGLFPEYDAGLYSEGESYMFVSRGLGNSAFPIRINNRPELALIRLTR